MRKIALPPALIVIGSHDTEAAAALAFGLADYFDSAMNRLTARFSLRDHRTPVIDGYVLDEYGLLEALKPALEQTVAIVAVKPGVVEWHEVLKELARHCTPALAHILLTDDEFNSRRAREETFTDTLALNLGAGAEAHMKYAQVYLRQRRGEIARDAAALYTPPKHPRIIRQEDFVPG